MKEYSGIAEIYDHLMMGIDFEDWVDYVQSILSTFSCKPKTVLDLACGTGSTIIPWAKRGYMAFGLDISREMIELARKKTDRQSLNIQYLVADMRHFKTGTEFDLVTCFHDGLNYLTALDDIEDAFLSVEQCLKPGGMFIFDLNTVGWLAGNSEGGVGFLDEENMTLIWESNYRMPEDIWDIRLTAFLARDGLYKKIVETHSEKAYSPGEIIDALRSAGLEYLDSYEAFTFDPAKPGSKRVFFVARKPEGA